MSNGMRSCEFCICAGVLEIQFKLKNPRQCYRACIYQNVFSAARWWLCRMVYEICPLLLATLHFACCFARAIQFIPIYFHRLSDSISMITGWRDLWVCVTVFVNEWQRCRDSCCHPYGPRQKQERWLRKIKILLLSKYKRISVNLLPHNNSQ